MALPWCGELWLRKHKPVRPIEPQNFNNRPFDKIHLRIVGAKRSERAEQEKCRGGLELCQDHKNKTFENCENVRSSIRACSAWGEASARA